MVDSKKILLVDDDEDIRKTVKEILEKNGYQVTTAVNGDECLESLEGSSPDLILLDIMMPGTPVKEIIERIKDVKIAFFSVVLTSDAEKEDLLKRPNIVGFFEKPFDIDQLVKDIGDLF